jgi:hypothetical protein
MMQGQNLAQQELQKRQLQRQEQQRAYGKHLLSILPQLNPASQEQALGFVTGMEGAFAAGKPFQFQPMPTTQPALTPGVAPMQEGAFSQIPEAMMPGSSGIVPSAPAPSPAATPALGQALSPERASVYGFAAPWQGLGRQVPQGAVPAIGTALTQGVATPEQIAAMSTSGATPVPYQPPSPAAAPTAPRGRGFEAPGLGRLTLRGVDPKEAQRALEEIGKTRTQIFSQAFIKDPNTQSAVRSILARVPKKPIEQWTEEEFNQVKQAQSDLDSTIAFLSRGNAQVQMGLDQAEVKQIGTDLGKLPDYRADNLRQELIRLKGRAKGLMDRGMVQVPSQLMAQMDDIEMMEQALAEGTPEGKQRAGLILGLIRTELTPKPKDKEDPVGHFEKLLGQAPRWANISPAGQRVFFNRLRQAAEAAGMDPKDVPDSIQALMRPGESDRLKLAAQREKRLANEQMWRRRFDEGKERRLREKDRLDRASKVGELTQQERARVIDLQKKRDNMELRLNTLQEKAYTDIESLADEDNPLVPRARQLEKNIGTINDKIRDVIEKRWRPGMPDKPKGGAKGSAIVDPSDKVGTLRRLQEKIQKKIEQERVGAR